MIAYIKNYFAERRAKKQEIKDRVAEVAEDYEKLIDQYRLIQEHKSGLSRRKRKMVVARVVYLIGKGHIKVGEEQLYQ